MSVGPGDGTNVDCELVRSLLSRGLTEYVAYEGDDAMIKGLRANLQGLTGDQSLKLDLKQQFFHCDLPAPEHKFDFILICHSLYYFEDRQRCIHKLLSEYLAPGGELLFLHQTEDGIYALQEHFGMQEHPHHYSTSQLTRDLRAALDDLAQSHPQAYEVRTDELESSFRCDNVSASLVQFLLERDYVDERLQKDVQEWFDKHVDDKLTAKYGAPHALHPNLAIRVTRACDASELTNHLVSGGYKSSTSQRAPLANWAKICSAPCGLWASTAPAAPSQKPKSSFTDASLLHLHGAGNDGQPDRAFNSAVTEAGGLTAGTMTYDQSAAPSFLNRFCCACTLGNRSQ